MSTSTVAVVVKIRLKSDDDDDDDVTLQLVRRTLFSSSNLLVCYHSVYCATSGHLFDGEFSAFSCGYNERARARVCVES